MSMFIGKPVLFSVDGMEASVGEIVAMNNTKEGVIYEVREAASNVVANDGFIYHTVTEDAIVKLDVPVELESDTWISTHMKDINLAFGKNMSDYIMFVYDSKEDLLSDFSDELGLDKYTRPVLDKWVIVIG